ncbi:MAG: T9SS type A sorting domain-containing protein [Melioribacteraceae bacterium]
MKKSLLFIIVIFTNSILFSQGIFSVSSNKTEYSYGETIEISVSIFNNSDTSIFFRPECQFPIWVRFKGVQFIENHSLGDGCERLMAPGEKETWSYKLDPKILGIPIENGKQVIYAEGYSHIDSIILSAPKYYGGIIEVEYNYLTEKAKRDTFFNSLSAEVIKKDTLTDINKIYELWQIQNASIDSLVYEQNRSENSFYFVDTFRLFEQGEKIITSINNELLPDKINLLNNYPNPFNPSTIISYSLPKRSFVLLRVYDFLGREIATITSEVQSSGFHSTILDGSNLASGVYYYQLVVGNVTLTKKCMLIK